MCNPERKQDEELSKKLKRKSLMAYSFKNRSFPNERQQAILDCVADDVSSEEVIKVIRMARKERYPEMEVGRVRIHYDELIDDAEKAVRVRFGINDDYTIVVKGAVHKNGNSYAQIDGLPSMAWALLYAPDRISCTPKNIKDTITKLENQGNLEHAEMLRKKYADIISESLAMTEYQLLLLNDDDYLPDSVSRVKGAISSMRKRGFAEEAEAVGKKYAWFINDDEFHEPLISREEAKAMLEELMKH